MKQASLVLRLGMSQVSSIPERTSTKGIFADIEADKNERRTLNVNIEGEAKKMKTAGSSKECWTNLSEAFQEENKKSTWFAKLLSFLRPIDLLDSPTHGQRACSIMSD